MMPYQFQASVSPRGTRPTTNVLPTAATEGITRAASSARVEQCPSRTDRLVRAKWRYSVVNIRHVLSGPVPTYTGFLT